MIEIPFDKLLKKSDSIYKLSILAAKRAYEVSQGSHRLVDLPVNTKPSVVALKEIVEGKVTYKIKEKKSN